jgi:epoxyqueuosine reductase
VPTRRPRSSSRSLRGSRGRHRDARAPARSAARTVSAAALGRAVEARARELGASVVGLAPVERWGEHGEVPEPYRPAAIWPQARTVVTFGVPMLLPIIDSTPSINHQELYDTANRLLDDVGYRLSVWLTDRGHPSFSLPRDGYGSLEVLLEKPFAAFSHVMAAKYAGLGTIGLAHNLVTPEYGPRLRLASIFTTAALPGSPVRTDDCCNGCRVCERLCPVGALEHRDDALIGRYDKAACTRHHITLRGEKHWPCGICVKVCPVGADRALSGSYTTRQYLQEKAAIAADPDDPRYRGLVHLRRHGSSGDRIA